jgi:hypothetical protein
MRRFRTAAAATLLLAGLGLAGLGACGHDAKSPTVPRLSAGGPDSGGRDSSGQGDHDQDHDNPNAVGGDGSAARRTRLHDAAQCIRQHGAPDYQDPLLTSEGFVYTDDVALRDLEPSQLDAISTACQSLIHAADFAIRDQGPPPPKLIAAGVRTAECMRHNGLPDYRDPTADTPFSPGKGFGLDDQTMPAGGKKNPVVQQAARACRKLLDAEAAQSSLGNLGNA